MSDTILYEVKNGIAHITLNRPESMNAINLEMARRWQEVLKEFNGNPDVRVGILRGAGDRAFCAGMDLKERAQRNATGERKPGSSRGRGMAIEPQKPMIAAINGYCVAGGMELTMFCDIRVATAKSVFGQPEPRRSLVPKEAVQRLPRMVPLGEALYILLTGETITAERACQIGFIHKVVKDQEELTAEAQRIADAVLQCAPMAVNAIKDIVMTGRNMPIEYSWKYGLEVQKRVDATEDAKEGPRAFAEKRPAQWKGR